MAVFEYTALSTKGRKVKGVVDADSIRAARQKLKAQDIYPTTIAEASSKVLAQSRDVRKIFSEWRVNAATLSLVTMQLATLLGAGLSLIDSLRALIDQITQPRLKRVFSEVCDRVNEGSSLADALRAHPKVFPHLYNNMVASGEASGTLDTVLKRLADLLDAEANLKRKIFAALSYPALMLLLCVGVVILLMTLVVPQLMQVFAQQKAELPLLTRMVIALSSAVKSYGIFAFLGLVLLFMGFRRYAASPTGRKRIDQILLRSFLIGPLTIKVAAARFAQTLGTLLQSGVTLLTALGIVKNIVSNVVLQQAIQKASDGVREGRSLARELDSSGYFPRMLIHMIAIGEKTGQLETLLLRAAANYDSELNALVSGLTAILNPILILFLAGIVGIIMLAVLLPMIDMVSLIR